MKPVLRGIKMLAVALAGSPLHSRRQPASRVDLFQHTIVTIEEAPSGIGKRQPRRPAQHSVRDYD